MQKIFPEHTPVDDVGAMIATERRHHDDGRPWVFVNMVCSIDGAVTVDGRSGDLGGEADRAVFGALRAEADVVLAGAETVRAEGYHLVREPAPAALARRRARGQADRARLCIVTRQPSVTGDPPLLAQLPNADEPAEGWQRPIVATVDTDGEDPPADPRIERWELGPGSVDLRRLVDELAARGLRRVLCEGGPTLLGQFAEAGLVDEWNFTIAATVVGGESTRAVRTAAETWHALDLDRLLLADDSTLLARYLTSTR